VDRGLEVAAVMGGLRAHVQTRIFEVLITRKRGKLLRERVFIEYPKHLEASGEGRLLTGAGRLAGDHIQPFPNLQCAA